MSHKEVCEDQSFTFSHASTQSCSCKRAFIKQPILLRTPFNGLLINTESITRQGMPVCSRKGLKFQRKTYFPFQRPHHTPGSHFLDCLLISQSPRSKDDCVETRFHFQNPIWRSIGAVKRAVLLVLDY